jgi:hypothetical protein
MSDFNLHLKIKYLRQRMELIAELYGWRHERVLDVSRELDPYIVEAQRRMAG